GIRDRTVTGVQTCALPIFSPQTHPEARPPAIARTERRPRRVPPCRYGPKPQETRQAHPNATANPGVKSRTRATSAHYRSSVGFRSEERRVGKECRCLGSTE